MELAGAKADNPEIGKHVSPKKNSVLPIKPIKKVFKFLLNSGIITWVLVIGLWWFAAQFSNEVLFPDPLQTLKGASEVILNGQLLLFAWISLKRVLIGWGLGIIIGIPLGVIIGRVLPVRKLLEPFINFFRFIPALALLTLFLMWFGVGEGAKIALITYGTVFVVIVNIIAGVVSIDMSRINAARVLGISEWKIILTVIWPSVIPYAFTGARLGLGNAFASIIAAEMISAKEGVGYFIYTARMYFHTDWILTGIIVLGLLGYFSDTVLRAVGNSLLKKYGVKEKGKFSEI